MLLYRVPLYERVEDSLIGTFKKGSTVVVIFTCSLGGGGGGGLDKNSSHMSSNSPECASFLVYYLVT